MDVDPHDVTDPEEALRLSHEALRRQEALGSWVQHLASAFTLLGQENHIAARMANLERSRRFPL